MHRNKQRIGQNEETEEYVPNEGTRQNLRKCTNEMEISSLPNKEFKVMIIKMLIELRRRMDRHSENL